MELTTPAAAANSISNEEVGANLNGRSRGRGRSQVAKIGNIAYVLLLIASPFVIDRSQTMAVDDMATDDLSLSLSAGSASSAAEGSMDMGGEDTSAIMSRIMADDCNDEFSSTLQTLDYVDNSLQQFALGLQLDPSKASLGNFISAWLTSVAGGQPVVQPDQLVVRVAGEFDYIYSTFWTQFKLNIIRMIAERPPDLNNHDLAFRCERYTELVGLQEMAQKSTLYRIILDIFSSEFYTHCLTRKLAIIKLNNIKPSAILQQFVDIYLDVPTHLSNSRSKAARLREEQTKAGLALNFNLQRSLALHGPLESAAELVFDTNSALSLSLSQPSSADLVRRFKSDCEQHSKQLVEVWGDFDALASYLSSPMNDLAAFNARTKNAAPQLVYGALCGQLAQTAASR